jgi:peptide/nickel transport system permease protein
MPALVHYIAHRLAGALLTLAGAILFLFVIIQFVPGDMISILLGPRATPELRAEFAQRMGLDRSIPEQIWLFFSRAITGDLGTDVISNRKILDMILDVLPNSLQLAGAALLISMVFGLALGCLAALKPGSTIDTVLGVVSVSFITTPAFVIAIFLLLIFSLQLH